MKYMCFNGIMHTQKCACICVNTNNVICFPAAGIKLSTESISIKCKEADGPTMARKKKNTSCHIPLIALVHYYGLCSMKINLYSQNNCSTVSFILE